MHTISEYHQGFLSHLETAIGEREPKSLYEPIRYILSLGGKRIRPVLTLLSAELFDEPYQSAIPAAIAVEVFHNFSLVHDDIMDGAPLRRGKETVHQKWDLNTGILSGDAMLILAYRHFEQYEPSTFRDLAKLFSKTALEVCEGQQWDVDFENREDVTIDEYLKMIEYKTAVLVAAAMKMGAIIARTSEDNCRNIYEFGRNLGIAFQIQDDYLDAFGNPETFGKQIGGDIIENKKTFLYLKAMEFADPSGKAELSQLFSVRPFDNREKIKTASAIFTKTGAARSAMETIREYTFRAFDTLEKLDISEEKKAILRTFGEDLMNRKV